MIGVGWLLYRATLAPFVERQERRRQQAQAAHRAQQEKYDRYVLELERSRAYAATPQVLHYTTYWAEVTRRRERESIAREIAARVVRPRQPRRERYFRAEQR